MFLVAYFLSYYICFCTLTEVSELGLFLMPLKAAPGADADIAAGGSRVQLLLAETRACLFR